VSYFNFYIGRLSYLDSSPTQNPKYQHFNYVTKAEGIQAEFPISVSLSIPPGGSHQLASTLRTLAPNLSTSEFNVSFPLTPDRARIRWTETGTAPNFRTLRPINYGTVPATTTYAVTSASATSKVITLTGAGVDLSSAVHGDIVYLQASDNSFTSPLNASSPLASYTVLSSTVNSITVRDINNYLVEETSIVLGADYDSVIRVFSATGVLIGDRVSFNQASSFSIDNKTGTYQVVDVTDRDLVVINPNAIPETVVSGVAAPFSIYNYLIKFAAIEANTDFSLTINGGTAIKVTQIQPYLAIFAGSTEAYSLSVTNNSATEALTLSFQAVGN